MRVNTLESLAKAGALAGKRVLIRSDLNVPRDENGRVAMPRDEILQKANRPADSRPGGHSWSWPRC